MSSEGKNLIGVDIGSHAIKLCELKEDRKGARTLVRFGYHPLAPETIVDGHIINSGAVIEGLEKLFHKAPRRDVALRASGHGVIIKKITLPMMTPAELAEQISWEAEQHIPFSLAEVQLDYQLLERHEDRGQMDVLLVAAKKEEINDLTAVAIQARLKPKVVDLDAFAIQNCYEAGYGAPGVGQTLALINIGNASTTLNILSNGAIAFTRDISRGGAMVTEEIQKLMGVDHDKAEELKTDREAGSNPQLQHVIQNAMEELAGEIQRSIDFFLATSSNQMIHQICVSGGCSTSAELRQAIEKRSRVPVMPIDPLRAATPDPKTVDLSVLEGRTGHAVVAFGLALRKEKEKRV